MKNFLKGLAIGLPVGILIAEAVTTEERSEMAEQMRQIWLEARARAQQIAVGGARMTRGEGTGGAGQTRRALERRPR